MYEERESKSLRCLGRELLATGNQPFYSISWSLHRGFMQSGQVQNRT